MAGLARWRRVPVCLLCFLLAGLWRVPAYAAQNGDWFTISDDTHTWAQEHSFALFDTGHPTSEHLLYPGAEGEYSFTLYNNAEFDLGVSLDVNDACDDDLPMEYRLLSGGEYLWGSAEEWLATRDFNTHNALLRSGRAYALTLQWRWVYSTGEAGDSQDTALGATANGQYDLEVVVQATGDSDGLVEPPGGYTPGGGTASNGGQAGTPGGDAFAGADPDGGPAGGTAGKADGTANTAGGAKNTGGQVQTGDGATAGRARSAVLLGLAGLGAALLLKRHQKEMKP